MAIISKRTFQRKQTFSAIFCHLQCHLPFSIGADHALEQQNRAMKVLGGIKGIANNQTALDEYFMTAGEMSSILDHFADQYDLLHSRNIKEHYQLSGTKNKRISDNTSKLSQILDSRNLTFNKCKVSLQCCDK